MYSGCKTGGCCICIVYRCFWYRWFLALSCLNEYWHLAGSIKERSKNYQAPCKLCWYCSLCIWMAGSKSSHFLVWSCRIVFRKHLNTFAVIIWNNKSVCSFLCQLTTWHCLHLLLCALLRCCCWWAPAVQQSVDISCPLCPQQQTHQWHAAAAWWDGQRDGWMDARQFRRPHSAYCAGSSSKWDFTAALTCVCVCLCIIRLRRHHRDASEKCRHCAAQDWSLFSTLCTSSSSIDVRPVIMASVSFVCIRQLPELQEIRTAFS